MQYKMSDEKIRIGIVTHYSANNFGAVLQCKALIDAISVLFPPVECVALDYESKHRRNRPTVISIFKQKRGNGFKGILKGVVHACIFSLNYCKSKGRTPIQDFIDTSIKLDSDVHIDETGRLYWDNGEIPYDLLICGSDQIWASWCMSPHFLLETTPNIKIPKIAYAPSFENIDKLQPSQISKLGKVLSGFSAVSCREIDGAELITRISKLDCPVMPDPTMLQPCNYWYKLARKPEHFPYKKGEFVFSYRISFMPHVAKIATRVAKKMGLPLVTCELVEPHAFYSQMGPQEFLWCIANAAHVITSSFHGTVFSVIFKIPFHTIRSNAPQERIITLLNYVGLSHRLVSSVDAMDFSESFYDKAEVSDALIKMREVGISWLKECIEREMSNYY